MQTIVNLVSAGIGLAWVPQSVVQFRRQGVVYCMPHGRSGDFVAPICETSLVWADEKKANHPALRRFVAFVDAQTHANTKNAETGTDAGASADTTGTHTDWPSVL